MKEEPRNPFKGIGRRLKLYIIIPVLYIVCMLVALIIGHCK